MARGPCCQPGTTVSEGSTGSEIQKTSECPEIPSISTYLGFTSSSSKYGSRTGLHSDAIAKHSSLACQLFALSRVFAIMVRIAGQEVCGSPPLAVKLRPWDYSRYGILMTQTERCGILGFHAYAENLSSCCAYVREYYPVHATHHLKGPHDIHYDRKSGHSLGGFWTLGTQVAMITGGTSVLKSASSLHAARIDRNKIFIYEPH
jgi:hypothetical protein